MAADQYDTGYSLVPGDDTTTPDERLQAAVTAIANPDPDVPAPYGRGWAFDFARNDFAMQGQAPAGISGVEQLVVWAEKALRTHRSTHPIYSDDFGHEDPFEPIGRQVDSGLLGAWAQRTKDALKVHDRVTDVTDFTFDSDPLSTTISVSFSVVTDDEEITRVTTAVGGT